MMINTNVKEEGFVRCVNYDNVLHKPKVDDIIIVKDNAKYTNVKGERGIITGISERYIAVKLNRVFNKRSAKGIFYFKPTELFKVIEDIQYAVDTDGILVSGGGRTMCREAAARHVLNAVYGMSRTIIPTTMIRVPPIKNVYFNYPYTIVVWEDRTKTIVKCQEGDGYTYEAGLALCIAKKALGNTNKWYDTFKKWLPKE